jgi:hypothetical protein
MFCWFQSELRQVNFDTIDGASEPRDMALFESFFGHSIKILRAER